MLLEVVVALAMKKTEQDLKNNFPVSDLWKMPTVGTHEIDAALVMAEIEKTMETVLAFGQQSCEEAFGV